MAMKMSEIKPGMRDLTIEAEVLSKQMVPTFMKPLAKALITDGSRKMFLNLWRNQIGQVKVGDRIKVKKCFARTSKGNVELNTWEDIEVVETKNPDAATSNKTDSEEQQVSPISPLGTF